MPNSHRAESCRDKHCERPYCRLWREAKAEGYEEAKDDFFMPRYNEGFADGVRAAEAQ